MPVNMKINVYGVRDALGRFTKLTSTIHEGLESSFRQAGEQITRIYREELNAVGIKQRTGKLYAGIGITRSTPLSVVVAPSADREEIALMLEEGVEEHELTGARQGHVYAMQKPGEGIRFRYSVSKAFIRPRHFMDRIAKRVEQEVSPLFDKRVGLKVLSVFGR